MASIRKRGSSYLIVVSMGYDYNGKRIKPQQKTVHPPEELTPKQVEKWLNEQAVLFERECRHTPQPVQQLTLAKYIDLWLTDIAPGKLAKSTIRRDRQDIERILPALGHYKLTELRPEHFRNFYAELRKVIRPDTKKPLSEYTIEGVHATLCSILSDAVEGGFFRIIRLGAPIVTPGASAKRKSRTRKRRRRSSPRWRARASSTKPTSSSSSPRGCGGASAAD
jgi:integrase